MQEYRAFILGPDGRVQGFVNLICENESEAIKAAKQLVDGMTSSCGNGIARLSGSTAPDNKNTLRQCAVPFAATRELVLLV